MSMYIRKILKKTEEGLKGYLTPGALFEELGMRYIGPIDGHDIKKIYKSLINKNLNKPKVIVANTIKGKGIKLFENDNNWHHSIITKSIYKNILKEL